MRRAVDIVISCAALTLLSPLLLLLAVAVIADSPGGPLFRGWRVGKDGKLFRIWKFRTMIRIAPGGSPITARNDPRVTRVGRLLRRTKLDELPQLVNVLAGEMTLVGPRPEAPEMVGRYTAEQRAVLAVRPGLTGQVQIDSGDESRLIPEEADPQAFYFENLMARKLKRDLEYLGARTPMSDVRIVFRTAASVLRACVGK